MREGGSGVAVPVFTYLKGARGQPHLPSVAAPRAQGWEFGGHPPAIVRAPGGRGICWPVPRPGRAVMCGRWPCGAILGWLVQAVLQPELEPGYLLLQLSDGLAGVGWGQQQRAHIHERSCSHPRRSARWGSLHPLLGGLGSNSTVTSF